MQKARYFNKIELLFYLSGEIGTIELLDNAYRLEPENIKEYYTDFGTLHYIPLNQKSIRLYQKLDEKNSEIKERFKNQTS